MSELSPEIATFSPAPLEYASAGEVRFEGWPLLRLAVLCWSGVVLVRHASFWIPGLLHGGLLNQLTGDPRPLLFAIFEAIVLGMSFVLARGTRSLTPVVLTTLARLAALFIAANLLNFLIDFVRTPGLFYDFGLKAAWMITSRVQLLVVPYLVIAMWAQRPSRLMDRGSA